MVANLKVIKMFVDISVLEVLLVFTVQFQTRAKAVLPNIRRTQGPRMSRSKVKVKVTAACSRRDPSVAARG